MHVCWSAAQGNADAAKKERKGSTKDKKEKKDSSENKSKPLKKDTKDPKLKDFFMAPAKKRAEAPWRSNHRAFPEGSWRTK